MSAPRHIAIVGCGFTGTSALFQLVDGYPVESITVFEQSGQFGPGYAYDPAECRDYLINNTTGTMCLAPWNRRAFLNWLEQRPHIADTAPGGHLPRALFGEFLRDTVQAVLTVAAIKGIRVTLVPARIEALHERDGGGVALQWQGGQLQADAVIVASGRCPSREPYAAAAGGRAYIASHVATDAFDTLALGARCCVAGASLSAYDVVNRLYSGDTGCAFVRGLDGALEFVPGPNARSVVLASRSGRLKKMQTVQPAPLTRRHLTDAALTGPVGMQDILRLARLEAEAHGVQIEWDAIFAPYDGCASSTDVTRRAGQLLAQDIAAATAGGHANFLVDLASDVQVLLWECFARKAFSAEEEAAYRANVEGPLSAYLAPCPVPTGEKLLALLRAGRLTVLQGVRSIEAEGQGYRIAHAHGTEHADALIDATGSVERDVGATALSSRFTPYARDGHAFGGADADLATLRATGARDIYLVNMYLWGPGLYTSSAFMMATLVERLLRGLYGR
ncbi:MAG TPA: FAD/NAD(P)-binding protein [Burkholderiaceae bacterium]